MELLEKELKNDHVTVLKSLVDDLISKEVSILQIARDNTGVITLTTNDVLWLSKLSRASLIADEDNSLKFDFRYVQSFIIRTHLLLCRINFRHIIQKYQCHKRNNQTNNDSETIELGENYSKDIERDKLEIEWSYLKDMLFDKLSNGHKLLRQIILLIKSNENKDLSHLSLNKFLDTHANDQTIQQQRQLYDIRDFQLCYLNHIQELYCNAISDFQYLFNDVPHLLRTPINDQLNEELKQMIKVNLIDVEYDGHVDKLKSTIHTISEFLNELREIEITLFEQSTQSLGVICGYLTIESPILLWIPKAIRCENYVPLSIHLIRCRSILQEKLVNIEEKQEILWTEEIDENRIQTESKNPFLNYLNSKEENSQQEVTNYLIGEDGFNFPPTTTVNNYHRNDVRHLLDQDDQITIDNQPMKKEEIINDKQIICPSLYTMQLKALSFEASPWFDSLNQLTTLNNEEDERAKPVTFIHPDGKTSSHLLRKKKLYEQSRKIFKDKGYSLETLILVDKYHIGLDLKDENLSLPQHFSLEYSILQKTSLIQIKIEYGDRSVDYFVKSECPVINVFSRSLNDPKLGLIPNADNVLCFFDENQRLIYDGIIQELFSVNDQEVRKLRLIVTEQNRSISFNEILYRTAQGKYEEILHDDFSMKIF